MNLLMRLRAVVGHHFERSAHVDADERSAHVDAEQSRAEMLRTDGGESGDDGESEDELTGDNDDENEEEATMSDGVETAVDDGVETTESPSTTDGETDETGESEETTEATGVDADGSNVEVTAAGDAEPAEPRWEEFDPEDIPEFEIRAEQPAGVGGTPGGAGANDQSADPTAGRPNSARSPGQSRIKQGGADGYIVAFELCARLPDDIRLPKEAADLVPTAVEAELEEDIRTFAAAEFETASPSVETLSFVDVDDELWMRLRLGISPEAFADLDPEEIREHALQQLEGLF